MSNKKTERNALSQMVAGFQVLSHFIRMLHQTVSRSIKFVMIVFVVTALSATYKFSDKTDWYMGLKYGYSYLFVKYFNMPNGKATLTLPNGRQVSVTDIQIVHSETMQNHAEQLINNLMIAFCIATALAVIVLFALYKYLRHRGREESKDEHLRGAELTESLNLLEAATDRVKEDGKPSRISIAGIPLTSHQENSGIALVGSPGTGKSTTMRDILRQMRAQKRKCVLYDISGEFAKRFYRPGKDIILNVFDERSASWDFWAEGKNPAIYDKMAKASIPDSNSGGDPFWTLAPQLLFSALLEELAKRSEHPDVEHLMNIILRMPNEKIIKVVATTDARNIMNLELDKLAGSVRAVISAYTRNFKYLSKTKGKRFSFRNWARNEESDAWVFITVRDDMKDTLKPLLTLMIESALSSILTLEPSYDRLIGVGLDEFATLHEIPSIMDFISTGRKFGALPMLGFQSNSQLDVTYGAMKAKVIMDSIGALAAFRVNGGEGSEWLAKELGDQETTESTENTSYGANDMRDATSINRSNKEQNLLLKSQISGLLDNQCYLKLGRGLPVAKLRFPYDNMPDLHPGIIEADYVLDNDFENSFNIENEKDPESVIAAINRDMDKREPQRNKYTTTKNTDTGKHADQILAEAVSSVPSPQNGAIDNGNVNPVYQAMFMKKSDSDTTEEGGSEESGFTDLSALAEERENNIEHDHEQKKLESSLPSKSEGTTKNTEKSIDIFDGFGRG